MLGPATGDGVGKKANVVFQPASSFYFKVGRALIGLKEVSPALVGNLDLRGDGADFAEIVDHPVFQGFTDQVIGSAGMDANPDALMLHHLQGQAYLRPALSERLINAGLPGSAQPRMEAKLGQCTVRVCPSLSNTSARKRLRRLQMSPVWQVVGRSMGGKP